MKAAFKYFLHFVFEDKSALRKSTLNMSDLDAKKAKAKEEEEAKKKARRFGTVSSLMNRFRAPEPERETYTYKRSPMLEQKEERPRRKFGPIVKPVINDDFDKQMEEIREKIKTGNTALSSQFADLKKGISSVADDARRSALEEKHRNIMHETGDLFNKAEDDAKKWKEQRAAEYEKELQRQEQVLQRSKASKVIRQNVPEPTPSTEPKRTVRRLKPPSETTKSASSSATEPRKTAEQKVEPAKASATKPSAAQADSLKSRASVTAAKTPVTPKSPALCATTVSPQKAATIKPAAPSASPPSEGARKDSVPRKESGLATFAAKFDKTLSTHSKYEPAKTSTAHPAGTTPASKAPSTALPKSDENTAPNGDLSGRRKNDIKSDGAAATRIKRVLANADNKNVKRYGATRKKTEELMNFAIEGNQPAEEEKPHRQLCVHRRNRFIREPFDIDDLLGFNKENTFEQFEARFAMAARDKRPSTMTSSSPAKRRRVENRRIWISELQDIDKLYKTSELRDIISSAK